MKTLKNIKITIIIFACLFGHQALAQAGSWTPPSSSPQGVANFRKKAEDKAKGRWTLADWLAQKERNRMMDLWLGMYSPSPYEFILGGYYTDYSLNIDNPISKSQLYSQGYSLAFYALALGIEGFYENNSLESFTDSGAMLGIRAAGKAIQNTHMIVQFGTRNKKSTAINLQQQFAALDIDIYVETHSGLHTNYRYYFPTTETTLGNVSGHKLEAGLFFDIGPVKLFWNWYSDLQTNQSGSSTVNQNRTGNLAGLKLFL